MKNFLLHFLDRYLYNFLGRKYICRITNKHKVKLPDDFDDITEIRCLRCNEVLSKIALELQEPKRSNIYDKSYINGCFNKKRFFSYQQAEQRMALMKARPISLHIYHCKHCKGFHLGNHKLKYTK